MCQQIQEWTVKGQAMMVAATRASIQRSLTVDEKYAVSMNCKQVFYVFLFVKLVYKV